MGESIVQKKSFEFAIGIIRLYRKLQARQEFVLSPHLLRSGTGVGLKVEQASAERDHQRFVDKILAAMDEARETQYWLRLLQASNISDVDVAADISKIEEIITLLNDIVAANWQT
jgi:four helix bundle protein